MSQRSPISLPPEVLDSVPVPLPEVVEARVLEEMGLLDMEVLGVLDVLVWVSPSVAEERTRLPQASVRSENSAATVVEGLRSIARCLRS